MSTLHAIIVLAAEESGSEHGGSKTLYYVLGLGLGVYALAVSFVGIRGHRHWPPTDGAAKGIMALSAVLVLATMASAVITS